MIPIALGGEHSLRNIVIVCPNCNGRKATLSYEKWIERIEPQHRARVVAVYQERYGPADGVGPHATSDSWVLLSKAFFADSHTAQLNQ
jgi:hypothetical protein